MLITKETAILLINNRPAHSAVFPGSDGSGLRMRGISFRLSRKFRQGHVLILDKMTERTGPCFTFHLRPQPTAHPPDPRRAPSYPDGYNPPPPRAGPCARLPGVRSLSSQLTVLSRSAPGVLRKGRMPSGRINSRINSQPLERPPPRTPRLAPTYSNSAYTPPARAPAAALGSGVSCPALNSQPSAHNFDCRFRPDPLVSVPQPLAEL